MFIKTILALLATAVVALQLVKSLRHTQRMHRSRAELERQRDDVKRWEAEGGNLPVKPQR